MKEIECIAMILAGGQGSRLGALTKKVAKPAVPFGAKYKIIDFTLSNCTNSGIDTVGVLTQYQPLELNTYIGNGAPWDMDRNTGGVFVLPPYVKAEKGEWYSGTANAIFQNVGFIEQFNPKYVLILSGDHIYKMNYSKMLKAHKEKGADCTIAVLQVPWEDTSRFGIMSTDSDGRIIEFEEKPKVAKSNLASMGVYIFSWQILKKYLMIDENTEGSDNDFGKNIIPAMLSEKERMYSYAFDGYWKDVGTVQSLWEANMDLLKKPPAFDLYDPDWKIFSRNPVKPPHFISSSAEVSNSCITEGCLIYGRVTNSIIFEGVKIEENATVKDSIVFPNSTIKKGAIVLKSIIGSNLTIGENAFIGDKNSSDDTWLSPMCTGQITLVADNCDIDTNVRVSVLSMVDKSILNHSDIGNNSASRLREVN